MERNITLTVTGTIKFKGLEGYKASDYRNDLLEEVLEDIMEESSPEDSLVASFNITDICDDCEDDEEHEEEEVGWSPEEIVWDETKNCWVPRPRSK